MARKTPAAKQLIRLIADFISLRFSLDAVDRWVYFLKRSGTELIENVQINSVNNKQIFTTSLDIAMVNSEKLPELVSMLHSCFSKRMTTFAELDNQSFGSDFQVKLSENRHKIVKSTDKLIKPDRFEICTNPVHRNRHLIRSYEPMIGHEKACYMYCNTQLRDVNDFKTGEAHTCFSMNHLLICNYHKNKR